MQSSQQKWNRSLIDNSSFASRDRGQSEEGLNLEGIRTNTNAMLGKKDLLFAPEQTSFNKRDGFELEMRNEGSSLHQVVSAGSLGDVRAFLLDENHNINKIDAQHGLTALHIASKRNRTEVVNLLLDFGANVDAKSSDGSTALHIASRFNAVDTMKALLDKGADPNASNTFNSYAPLHEATAFGHLAAVECLLGNKKTHVDVGDTQGITPLHLTCCHGYYDVCSILLNHGASAEVRTTAGMTALHYAASNVDAKVVTLLLETALPQHVNGLIGTCTMNPQQRKAFLQFINNADSDQSTPLHKAVQAANIQVVELLLKHGANVNAKKRNFQTSLHLAAFRGNPDILRVLISRGAEIDVKDELQRTPLHIAASIGNLNALGVLLKNGAQVEATDDSGQTAFLAAVSGGQSDCVIILQEAGATLESRDLRMRSSIHLAVSKESVELLSLLLQKTEPNIVNSPDVEGRTPLHYAIHSTKEQILKLLLQKKAICCVKDLNHKTPLHLAAEMGKTSYVEALCRASLSSIFEQDDFKRTPLHIAAMNKRRKACVVLIGMGADILSRDSCGHSPLSLAALSGSTEVVRLLVDKNVPLDSVDTHGNTAMHLAARRGHVPIVQILLDHGARTILNDHSHNCLNVAMEQNKQDVVMALVKHNRWQDLLLTHRSTQENPLRKLILDFPSAAKVVFDRCVQWSDPNSPERSIAYDFRLLDPGPDGQIGPDGKRFCGLETMVKGKQQELLLHVLSRKLINVKWRTYGWYVFWINFAVYTVFIALLTLFMLVERSKIQLFRPGNQPAVNEDYKESGFDSLVPYFTFVFAVVNLVKELYQIFSQGTNYFTHLSNYLEWALYGTAILFVIPQIKGFGMHWLNSRPQIYWQMGTWCIFLSYVNFILFLRTLSFVGLYVTMFLEVTKTMLKASCLFIMFLLGFSVVFYILFKEEDAFETIWKAIVKVTVMLIGEFDYSILLVDNLEATNNATGAPLVPYKESSFVLFYFFLWIMPIILMNLLVGLAVGDIESIQKNAFLRNKARKISFLVEIENKFPKFVTRRLYKPTLVTKSSIKRSIFTRKTIEFLDDDLEVEAIHDQSEEHYQSINRELGKMKGRMKEVMTALKDIQKTVAAVASKAESEERF